MSDVKTAGQFVYLDHAATTAIRPIAADVFMTELARIGNPSSLHTAGRQSRRVVEESRESLAAELGVRPNDVVFTSGGTEADNSGIKGVYWARRAVESDRRTVLVSTIEHHAVLDAVKWLVDHEGARVAWIPTDSNGVIDVEWLRQYLPHHAGDVALCAVMWANNETGVTQPIATVSELCEEFAIPLHCDGVQAAAWLAPDRPWHVGASSLAISAHKFGGPVGVGALVVNGLTPTPLLHGGGQEIDVRSGTVATALVAAMAAAFTDAARSREADRARLNNLTEYLRVGVARVAPDCVVVGESSDRLPNIVAVTFPGCQADALLMLLDAAGIACSAGSACTAGVPRPSHVLLAMGISPEAAQATLRFSFGWNSTVANVDAMLSVLPTTLDRARNANRSRAARGLVAGAS